jgi:hypothetical protein
VRKYGSGHQPVNEMMRPMNDYQLAKEALWQQLRERIDSGVYGLPENADLLRELLPPEQVIGLNEVLRLMGKGE